MAKAITYNNAGIVEAIKRNSGSTKFYKPNFQGIIEAIEDWQGGSGDGTGGIDAGSSVLPEGGNLPNTNNKEGDLVVIPNGDGDYFMYVFANGSWERLHITTEEVETAGSAPFAVVLPDGTVLKNQANINAYLDERITALSEKGYDDTGIKAELAQEILDREAGDQALHDRIDALHPEEAPEPIPVYRLYRFARSSFDQGDIVGSSEDSQILGTLYPHPLDLAGQEAPSASVGDQIELKNGDKKYLYKINELKDGYYKVEYVEGEGDNLIEGTRYTVTFYIYPVNFTNRILEGEEKQAEIIESITTALATQEEIVNRVEDLPTWIAENPPADKADGDLWFDSGTTGQLYVRYGGEWVVACPPVTDDELAGTVSDVEALANTAMQKANLVEYSLYQQGELLKWDQERQDNQLKILEGEIEQLAPSFVRGAWMYDDGDGIAQGTEYVLSGVQTQEAYDAAKALVDAELMACNEAAAGDSAALAQCNRDWDTAMQEITPVGGTIESNQWELANKVSFSYTDLDGTGHMFDDVEVGQLLDMVCEDGSGFMVAEITGVTLSMWYEEKVLDIKPIQFKGVANGRTAVKIFTLDNTVDSEELTNFVRKSGDTMTGDLLVHKRLWIKTEDSSTNGWNAGNVFVVNQQDADTGSIVRIKQNGTDRFKIMFDGNTSLEGNKLKNIASPEHSKDAANREYVDLLRAPAKYAWKHRTVSSKEPEDEYIYFDKINWAQRHEKVYFSPTPAIGPKFKFPKSKIIVDKHGGSTTADSPYCTVWKAPKSDGTWELQGSFRVERVETDSNGILVVTIGQDGWGSCGAEHEIVYFTIGGLF